MFALHYVKYNLPAIPWLGRRCRSSASSSGFDFFALGRGGHCLKRRLAEIEKEDPETSEGWKQLSQQAGLVEVVAVNRSDLIPQWTRDFKKRLGILGQLSATWHILKRWGIRGLRTITESEGIFRSEHMGYCLIAGLQSVHDGRAFSSGASSSHGLSLGSHLGTFCL
jgi:hypothetical protein